MKNHHGFLSLPHDEDGTPRTFPKTINSDETVLTINYDTGERYLSIEGLFTE